jgi:hypothetical protein
MNTLVSLTTLLVGTPVYHEDTKSRRQFLYEKELRGLRVFVMNRRFESAEAF